MHLTRPSRRNSAGHSLCFKSNPKFKHRRHYDSSGGLKWRTRARLLWTETRTRTRPPNLILASASPKFMLSHHKPPGTDQNRMQHQHRPASDSSTSPTCARSGNRSPIIGRSSLRDTSRCRLQPRPAILQAALGWNTTQSQSSTGDQLLLWFADADGGTFQPYSGRASDCGARA